MVSHEERADFQSVPAEVPGTLYADLLDNGLIDDPLYRDNEASCQWIGESGWCYERQFELTESQVACTITELICEGLDTLATVSINGHPVLEANNQFRTWRVDVTNKIQTGINTIRVSFRSVFPFIQGRQEERWLNGAGVGVYQPDGGSRVRKSPCNFGWDWGPKLITCGICAPIHLHFREHVEIENVHVRQTHLDNGLVDLVLNTELNKVAESGMTLEVILTAPDESSVQKSISLHAEHQHSITLTVENPELWWPNGLGDHPLYTLEVTIYCDGEAISHWIRQIGLRTIKLGRHPDQWGESFQFEVNGRPIFSKGANWIPPDVFPTRATPELYEQLIKASADANMNMLRAWGGGIYESDVFFDLCDRYGILVWQDFMFACAAYPVYEEGFMDNVVAEVKDNILRIRHHACLALWCGNNEIEHVGNVLGDDCGCMTWDEYRLLFDNVLQQQVLAYDPDTPYWPSSPHTPIGDRLADSDPTCGDAHLWDVWHGGKPFELYRTCEHRFASEFGFQSFPEPATIRTYCEPEDFNISSYMMEYHQRSPIGNSAIITYLLSWFNMPKNFHSTIWLSHVLQGMAMKYAIEHWRRSMPRGMGTLYWQLNDCWGGPSWSSIDYLGKWKALHYMARDFYSPLLISGVEDRDTLSVDIHTTNDTYNSHSAQVRATWASCSGDILQEDTLNLEVKPFCNTKVLTTKYTGEHHARDLILHYELIVDGLVVSKNMSLFCQPKHLELQQPKISHEVTEDGSELVLSLATNVPALWVWIEHPQLACISNQFFHLLPNQSQQVRLSFTPERDITDILDTVSNDILISSLRDTFE